VIDEGVWSIDEVTTEEDRSTRVKTYTSASLSTTVLLMGFNCEGIDKQDM
jgi:hypothetical protein